MSFSKIQVYVGRSVLFNALIYWTILKEEQENLGIKSVVNLRIEQLCQKSNWFKKKTNFTDLFHFEI